MRTEQEAIELKGELERRNPGASYEVAKSDNQLLNESPWYVRRLSRGEVPAKRSQRRRRRPKTAR
ncbi:MAG TPA: hypothetical protein VIS51_03990 [Solirubrobacterales bacterium]